MHTQTRPPIHPHPPTPPHTTKHTHRHDFQPEQHGHPAALPEALAVGDMIWRTGQYTADAVKANSVPIYGIGTSGSKWRGTA